MQRDMKKKARLREPIPLTVNKPTYQPSRKELREEVDMPGLSLDASCKAFARPFDFKTV